MHRLASRDWHRLHQAVVDLLDAHRNLAEFAGRLGSVLEALMPARRISLYAFHLPNELQGLYESRPEPLERERSCLLWQHSHEIPYLPDFSRGVADGPFRLLDHLSRRQWQATVLYNEWLREAGTEDALSVLIPLDEHRTKLSINLVRDGRRGFSRREVSLLWHLRPVLQRILRARLCSRMAWASVAEASVAGPEDLRELGLSARQAEVLWWMMQGKSNWEIARILGVGEATVCEHSRRLYDKLGTGSRHAAAAAARHFLSSRPQP